MPTRSQVLDAQIRASNNRHVVDVEHDVLLQIARQAVADRIVLAAEIGRLKSIVFELSAEIQEFAQGLIDKELNL